uniref:uncharacterized protein LOC122589638 n=1 Tax=Erigeron canadensis TaxID=72917 RepID=UPI001CB9B028|nr:uncharacterized protein LOC122589638 [Erigeron canadensis]
MSVLTEYPDAKKDVRIWHNAVFDNDSESLNPNQNQIKSPSWMPMKSVSKNPCLDSSISCKENQSPIVGLSNSKNVVLINPLHQSKPLKNLEIGNVKKGVALDEEIEIEKEIARLYARLEEIRMKKTEQNVKNNSNNLEKQGSSAKFLDPVKNNKDSCGVKKKIEDSSSGFSKTKMGQRRGFSLGPNEISNLKSKQLGNNNTPVQVKQQDRRKSCFWKLDDIEEEEKFGFSKGKNSGLRNAVTTIGAKKGMKKDDLVLASVQPKKLFGEQSVKKPLKPGRVIPSRYNQATVNSLMKKKTFTDNVVDRKSKTEGRVKRKWEIPSEIVIPKRLDLDDDDDNENDDYVGPIDAEMPVVVLPRIRAVRCVDDPGRDSGPAKRVAQLVGKKSYFQQVEEEEEEETVCQKLSFEED